ncbi:hypothetical protein SCALM49S_03732 [Streptomyces californicus]
MARPRQFDEERALDAAMRTFWEYGYEAASTQDLCDATGLGRSSIYNTFRSKRELFARSLARYLHHGRRPGGRARRLSRPPGERVRALLDKIVADEFDHRPDGRSLGCLAGNSTVELAAREPEVARLLDRDAARRLRSLSGVIAAGLRDGSITSGRGPDALARYVNAVIGGMRIAAQGGADRAAVQTRRGHRAGRPDPLRAARVPSAALSVRGGPPHAEILNCSIQNNTPRGNSPCRVLSTSWPSASSPWSPVNSSSPG